MVVRGSVGAGGEGEWEGLEEGCRGGSESCEDVTVGGVGEGEVEEGCGGVDT